LLSYQTFLAYFSTKVIEGATGYKDYDTNNPNNIMMLTQQNAGNIMALKSQLGDMGDIKSIITDISGNVSTLQNQVYELVKAQKQQGEQMAGSEPIDASDSTDNTNANTTDNATTNTTDNAVDTSS
jgi:hypothetical protein